MAYNKIEADSKTLIDLTSDTVTADTLLSGRTAHLASGERVMGTFEPVTGVKGNAETSYRKGNVNLTAANIGAATSAQGTKADSAVQTIKMNGNAVTKTSGVVDLGTVITAHQDISGKADKSATVSNVTYDTTNKKLTKTINGKTSDVVTTAKLKTDMALSKSDVGLGNVDNTSDANKPISTATQAALDKQQAQIDYNTNQGVKNLCKITAESRTISGVTFTVDKVAGTITVNGTATANVWFEPIKDLEHYYPANVRLTGCPSGGSNSTYYLGLVDAGGAIPYRDHGNGCDIPVAYIKRVTIGIVSGFTCNNLVFKPMIRDASIKDDTFQPYAMSNAELTQKAIKRDVNNDVIEEIRAGNITATRTLILTSNTRAILQGLNEAKIGAGTAENPGIIEISATNNLISSAIKIVEDTSGNGIEIGKNYIQLTAGGNTLELSASGLKYNGNPIV